MKIGETEVRIFYMSEECGDVQVHTATKGHVWVHDPTLSGACFVIHILHLRVMSGSTTLLQMRSMLISMA